MSDFDATLETAAALDETALAQRWVYRERPMDVRYALYRTLEDAQEAHVRVAAQPHPESRRILSLAQRAFGDLRGLLVGLPADLLDRAPREGRVAGAGDAPPHARDRGAIRGADALRDRAQRRRSDARCGRQASDARPDRRHRQRPRHPGTPRRDAGGDEPAAGRCGAGGNDSGRPCGSSTRSTSASACTASLRT